LRSCNFVKVALNYQYVCIVLFQWEIFKMIKKFLLLAAGCMILWAAPALQADDAEASEMFQKGIAELQEEDFVDAAKYFAKAEFLADSPELKFRAASHEVNSYRRANYLGKEYEALEKLIRRYPTKIDLAAAVDRQYAIGDAYFHGYADPAFWSLRFIPWLTDKSRMVEVYESALKHAPFAAGGANARLRLAIHYLKNVQNDKAFKLLREVIQLYPQSESAKFAMLELGNALSELSLAGDGDGRNYDEAMSVFREFKQKYPKSSENEWVVQCENRARNAYAQRLHNIAEFYYREGNRQPAITYLTEVMRRFPGTPAAVESEKLLTELDQSYFPEQIAPETAPEYMQHRIYKLPAEERKLLLAPENSNGKFLLPIYDLNLKKENK